MRSSRYILVLLLYISCEDVVDVDLPPQEPRLIVDALIRLDLENDASPLRIKVNTTGDFFEENTPTPLERMQIINETITDVSGTIFLTPDPEKPNEYVPLGENGAPVPGDLIGNDIFLDGRLILTFVFQDELYLAETRFAPSPPIRSLEQGTSTVFGEDNLEMQVTFKDLPSPGNFYVFDFDFNEFLTLEDRFINDQEFTFSYFYENSFDDNQEVTISILGATEAFYNYMDLLIEQSDLTDGGPFQVPVTTVRGNILKVEGVNNIDIFDNVGRPQEFVLGYFAVAQEHKESILISN
ncbi:MAG: DUF4249 family protein [Dokdonia sp.]